VPQREPTHPEVEPVGPEGAPTPAATPNGPPCTAGEEPARRAGLTPRQAAVAELLTQLATTARSFLFYDARNDAIHDFLTRLLDRFAEALRVEPQVALEVQPFELHSEGQAVYVNRDREQSLAFRMYRDGVRGLTFRRGFGWEELTRLLEVLSVRYAGVHQHEDDIVTLLWKANFEHLDVIAVEGFTPEDEQEEKASGGADAPPGFVVPDTLALPALPPPVAPAWVPVSQAAREALRSEASAAALPLSCLALLSLLRRQLEDRNDPLPFFEVAHLFAEVRDFLLAEEHLRSLLQLVDLLVDMQGSARDPDTAVALGALLASCGDRRAMAMLLRTVPTGGGELRPELAQLLDQTCLDPLATVADALEGERGGAARSVARALIVHYGRARLEWLKQRFAAAEGHAAADLLEAIAEAGGPAVSVWVAEQCGHPETAVQERALAQVEKAPYSGSLGRALIEAFRRSEAFRRPAIVALMSRSGDRRFVAPLAQHVESHAGQLEAEEAEAIGCALGRLAGAESAPRWRSWLEPAGLLGRVVALPAATQIAAAAALAELPGVENARALRRALASAGPDTRDPIGRALSRQMRLGRVAS
jgi:hypothetical protein